MARYAVGERVRLRSGKLATVVRIWASKDALAMDTFYHLRLDEGGLIKLDELHIVCLVPNQYTSLDSIAGAQYYNNLPGREVIGPKMWVNQTEFLVRRLTSGALYTSGLTACTGVAMCCDTTHGPIVGLAHYDGSAPSLSDMYRKMLSTGAVAQKIRVALSGNILNQSGVGAAEELAKFLLNPISVYHDESGEMLVTAGGQVGRLPGGIEDHPVRRRDHDGYQEYVRQHVARLNQSEPEEETKVCNSCGETVRMHSSVCQECGNGAFLLNS